MMTLFQPNNKNIYPQQIKHNLAAHNVDNYVK